MKSILQDKNECYLSHSTTMLDKHHIYGKYSRKVSEDNGFWVYLNHYMHIHDSPYRTPHNDRETDLFLKRECQKKYEETHTREQFVALIGRNYL